MKNQIIKAACVVGVALIGLGAQAEGLPEVAEHTITIKDHQFTPDVVEIAQGQKLKLTVVNQDSSPEEFESHELKREKVIAGNSEGVVIVGPLEPGTYPFVGEFHEDTAKGKIVVSDKLK